LALVDLNIVDGSALEKDLKLEGDVAIIGTGAGGGTAAEILAAAGLNVVMIEEGGYFSAPDFTMRESDAYPDLYQESASRKTKDKAIAILQGRAVGGSTTVNWTTSFRTPEQTLAHWADVHGLSSLTAADMLPWFARMERRLNIHRWNEADPNENNDILLRGARKLGWHAELVRRNVKNCQNLGYCGLGCPVDAKQSMLVTTIPAALDHGSRLITRTRAERLQIADGRVTGIECLALDAPGVRPTGRRITVVAPQIILAAGGINGPGLLLRSQAPDPHGNLGKRTFLHLVNVSSALMTERVEGFYGAPQTVYSDEFLWRDGAAGRCGYKLEVPPIYPAISMAAAKIHGRSSADMAKQFAQMHSQIALMRDGFHPESPGGTVELRDDGSPVLNYPLTDYLRDGMRRAFLSMAEAQFAAGAKRVFPLTHDTPEAGYRSWAEARKAIPELTLDANRMTLFSAHVMGGCAMGPDSKSAVADASGRHHHLENLTICDGSLFPTSLGANPQLSIYGIAARIAASLAARLAGSQSAGLATPVA
jgi:choline dehydrogenase-like flavoprotein